MSQMTQYFILNYYINKIYFLIIFLLLKLNQRAETESGGQ